MVQAFPHHSSVTRAWERRNEQPFVHPIILLFTENGDLQYIATVIGKAIDKMQLSAI